MGFNFITGEKRRGSEKDVGRIKSSYEIGSELITSPLLSTSSICPPFSVLGEKLI